MIHSDARQRRRERGITDNLPRCSRCDEPNPRPGQRYCGRCHAEYMKGWRAENVSRGRFCSTLRGIDA